jgi:cytochrome c oxidase cbb3-type subunit 2
MVQAGMAEPDGGLIERYGEKVNIRDFDGNERRITEMDALIAYMQMLGTLVDLSDFEPAEAGR